MKFSAGRNNMASTGPSALQCHPDEEGNCGPSLQTPYNNTSNEILLFHNNNLLLKAERGVTLGLIKLIYSSDEDNSGIILGVKPKLTNQVPCLVTFDSTSLTYDAYDLIIKDFRSCPNTNEDTDCNAEQSSFNLLQNVSIGGNADVQNMNLSRQELPEEAPSATQSKDFDLPTCNAKVSSSYEDQSTDDSLESPTGANNVFLENSTEQNDSFKSVELQDISQTDFSLSESENSLGTDGRKNDPEEEKHENEEESETEESFQFNPEDFDFDIKSVTPTKTDKGLRWPCNRCGKDYCSASHLKRHWILHTDFKPYKCSLCSKHFPFHWDLKRHMTKHTGNKRYKCPHCTKSFNTQKELKCHNWLHTGHKMYKCDICHHEISSSGNLKIHMRKHTGEKPYKCEYCPKAFYMMGHYQYHVRRHTGEKPYKCDVCGMAFSYSVNLNEHKNIHTGTKPYSCPTCDKRFTHRSTLKQHILTHSGQRPYKCHLCPKNFIQSSNYRMHLLTHKDKQDRAQKCDLCGKELLSRRGVKKHRQRCAQSLLDRANGVTSKKNKRKASTKERYECGICSKLFTYRANYEAHCKLPHPIKKKQKERLTSKQNKSVNSTSNNKVACPICGKQFLYMNCIKRHLQKRHAGIEVGTRSSNAVTCRTSTRDQMEMLKTTGDSENNDSSTHTSASEKTEAVQAELPDYVQALPTVHIQPVGEVSSSNVTLIYVPSSSAQSSSTANSTSLLTVLPKTRQDWALKTSKAAMTRSDRSHSQEHSAVVSDSASASCYSLSKQTSSDKTSKGAETGSQAITALKRLSAKIGIEDQFQTLSSRKDEQRPPISKHLTALEQLSKRVGVVEEIPVAIETVHEPNEQITVGSITKDQANSQIGYEVEGKGSNETNTVQEK